MDVKKLISDFSIAEKIELYNCLYTDLSGKGIGGDTELAHVNPEEMAVLRAMGGAGTINPNTNLIQFIGGGGASSPPPPPAVQTQVQQSEFPSELKPFISDIFGKAQAIQEQREEEGFQAFPGPLQAQFDPAQTRAFEQIEQVTGATQPLFDEATTLAREATRSPTDPQEVASFMNPFLRNVTDIQKREAQRIGDVEEQQLAAQAAQAGAFGGSRAAILEAERQRNLAQQLDDIEARGLAASYQDAQQRLANQRAREAAGATQLASLGSAIPAQQLKELGALSGVGAARQTQAQRGIDLARQEFEAEEAFPLRTLQEFSSILRGFPIEPTRTTTKEQFSAAQPLSTQLLGVGTQALGALGAAGLKPFGQAGGMVREMPVKAQSGGALGSLMEKTQDLDTSPVIGMKRGGSFMEQLLTGGLLSTDKARDMARKLPTSAAAMLGGAGLPKLLNQMGSRAQAPAASPRAIPQEEIDKQIDAMLRQRAGQGQQMAARGAGPAQVGAQIGQVRQAFKGGGGLRQMVQLPVQKMQEGGTPIYPEVDVDLKDIRTLGGIIPDFYDYAKAGMLGNIGVTFGPALTQEELGEMAKTAFIGDAPAALAAAAAAEDDASQVEGASELDIAPAPKAPDTPDPDKKKKGEDLYRSPEEAAYASLMDSKAGQRAADRYFKGENVTLANISEALKAYKGFKDTEMAQRRAINEANIKKAAAADKRVTNALERVKIMSETARNIEAPSIDRAKALGESIKATATLLEPMNRSFMLQQQGGAEKVAALEKQLERDKALQRTLLQESGASVASREMGQLTTLLEGLSPQVQKTVAGMVKGKG